MGSYATLRIGEYDFIHYKNYLDSYLLFIYCKNDKKTRKCYRDDGEEYIQYTYSTTADKAKQCLDIIGYTLSNSKKDFERYKCELDYEFETIFGDNAEEIYNEFTFKTWSNSVMEISKKIIDKGNDNDETFKGELEQIDRESNFSKYLIIKSLIDWNSELYFGMPYEMASWSIIRVVIENIPDATEIILDYTDLVSGGWHDPEQEIENFYGSKIIVMTEGKSDSKILSKSLEILYPHLHHFYYFMDFDISKAQGSTNFLTHYIKAFIGAGIENKIIALFDNDAAARNELINLKDIRIPSNIRIMTLPNIDLANNYPTIGPFDNQNVNINGLACSIELFLGEDILRDNKGQLKHVVWKGYIERINKYQGEIADKNDIQQRFFHIIDQIENGFESPNNHDWRAMDKLLQMIFNAFQ